ncbi:MAG: hypothetical protein CL707_07850 [Chloroflexi bacterium]|nr:hypothetical protein [Chloroflexota bacterium]
MFATTEENFLISSKSGLKLHGFGKKYRKRTDRMNTGDEVIYYLRDKKRWCAVSEIETAAFEDSSPIWLSSPRGEDFRYRVRMNPKVILDEEQYVDASLVAPTLDYLKRWPLELWNLAFIEDLHLLPQKDFRFIEGEINRAKNA